MTIIRIPSLLKGTLAALLLGCFLSGCTYKYIVTINGSQQKIVTGKRDMTFKIFPEYKNALGYYYIAHPKRVNYISYNVEYFDLQVLKLKK